ncbi:MAG: hypothetical protein WAQ27_00660 [Candidatus Microsaccharimonas sp.]
MSRWIWWVIWPAVVAAVIYFIYWLIAGLWLDALAINIVNMNAFWHWALWPNGWNLIATTPFAWILASIILIIAFWIWGGMTDWNGIVPVVAIIASVVLLVGSIVYGGIKLANKDIEASKHYLTTTSFAVDDPNTLPEILAEKADEGQLVVPIKQADVPADWAPRVASATGALTVIKKSGSGGNNAPVMEQTVSYVYGDGDSGKWTVIRNGRNLKSIYGVASWNGVAGAVETCKFTDDYKLDKAFGGIAGNNLSNSIAGAFPSFYYDEADMWGYCKGEEPIIVIPGVNHQGFDVRTVDNAAGVVVVQGSPSGQPIITLRSDVKPGEFPGPVYAQSLVNNQRDSLTWAAGFGPAVGEGFGFETTSVKSQSGNNANYLLKSKVDGRMYWVNPLQARQSDSELLIGYSLIPADEVTSGTLNPQTVYVLSDGDPRVIDLNTLYNSVKTAVCVENNNFCGEEGVATGEIVEFLPISATKWQAFGEVDGQVYYRFEVDVDSSIVPTMTVVAGAPTDATLDGAEPGPTPTPVADGALDCNSESTLTSEQILQCIANLAGELKTRADK